MTDSKIKRGFLAMFVSQGRGFVNYHYHILTVFERQEFDFDFSIGSTFKSKQPIAKLCPI